MGNDGHWEISIEPNQDLAPEGWKIELIGIKKDLVRAANTSEVMDEADLSKGREVYAITETDGDGNLRSTKVGISNDTDVRIKNLQTGNSDQLEVIHKEPVSQPAKVESEIHTSLKEEGLHKRGEFFNIDEEEAVSIIKDTKKEVESRIILKPDVNGRVNPYSDEILD
jgi:hypothetical protein